MRRIELSHFSTQPEHLDMTGKGSWYADSPPVNRSKIKAARCGLGKRLINNTLAHRTLAGAQCAAVAKPLRSIHLAYRIAHSAAKRAIDDDRDTLLVKLGKARLRGGSGLVARSLKSRLVRSRHASRAGTFGGSSRSQRVLVQARVRRHRDPKATAEMLRDHAAYLQRDEAGQDGQKPEAYSADRDDVTLKPTRWSSLVP